LVTVTDKQRTLQPQRRELFFVQFVRSRRLKFLPSFHFGTACCLLSLFGGFFGLVVDVFFVLALIPLPVVAFVHS
jgi:hypothetical protein